MRIQALGILLGGLAVALPSTAQAPKPAASDPAETLSYDVTWSVFDAGKVTATLDRPGSTPGDDVHARAVARSQGFASILFDVQDQFDSSFTSDTLCSRHIAKKINEGSRHRDFEVAFDPARHLALLTEKVESLLGVDIAFRRDPTCGVKGRGQRAARDVFPLRTERDRILRVDTFSFCHAGRRHRAYR